MSRIKAAPALLVATIAGLALAVAAVGWVGLAAVLAAAGRIGWAGFVILMGYSVLPLALLGSAWWAVTPGVPGPPPRAFVWARTVREGATDILPFAQFGGLLVGARALIAAGVGVPRAWASIVADISTELAAQLVFTLFGVGALALVLAGHPAAGNPWPVIGGGIAVSVAVLVGFIVFQRRAIVLVGALAERVLPGAAQATVGVTAELAAIYARRSPVIMGFLLNLAAWIASAGGAWLVLRLMGVAIPLWAVLTIESLIFTLRSAAFMLPGGLGLQEAAYALIGPVFGVNPATAIALSLIKRARDLAIGGPALLLWQVGEGRRALLGGAIRGG